MPRGRRRKYDADNALTDAEYRKKYQQEYFLQDPNRLLKFSIQQEIRKKQNAILRAEQKIVMLKKEVELLQNEYPTEVGVIKIEHEPKLVEFT